jgi:hypothetical protein
MRILQLILLMPFSALFAIPAIAESPFAIPFRNGKPAAPVTKPVEAIQARTQPKNSDLFCGGNLITLEPIKNKNVSLNPLRPALYAADTLTPELNRQDFLAIGPVFGSSIDRKLKSKITCKNGNFEIDLTVVRSANYNGATLKNALWQPEVNISLRRSMVSRSPMPLNNLRVTWKMQLEDGTSTKDIQFPHQKFPMVFDATKK